MRIKNLTYVGMFSAMIGVLGLMPPIPVPLIPVPITLQTLGIMLAGSLLGKKWGSFSVFIFLLLVFAGLPLLSGGRGGIASFLTPTGGFLISWFFATFVIGWILEKFEYPSLLKISIANIIGGIVVVYLIGSIQLSLYTGLNYFVALASSLIFIPGDLVKVLIASFVTIKINKQNKIKLE